MKTICICSFNIRLPNRIPLKINPHQVRVRESITTKKQQRNTEKSKVNSCTAGTNILFCPGGCLDGYCDLRDSPMMVFITFNSIVQLWRASGVKCGPNASPRKSTNTTARFCVQTKLKIQLINMQM